MKNLDELGFSVASTVIPKAGAIRVAAFLPSDILDPSSSDLKKHHPLKHPNSFSTYKGSELRTLFSTMSVQVAGSHVQEVSPTATPTLDLFVTALPTLADLSKPVSVTIQGSGLDSVRTVELISSDGKTVLPASLSALPGAKTAAVDPHVAVLTIPAAADSPSGSYAITFILADGTTVDTGQSIVIPTPPVVATATADAATFQAIPANGKLTVTLTGTALTNLKAVSLQNGTTAPVPGVITANGTDVSVTVTFPQTALAAGTYKILIGTSAAAAPATDSTKQITL